MSETMFWGKKWNFHCSTPAIYKVILYNVLDNIFAEKHYLAQSNVLSHDLHKNIGQCLQWYHASIINPQCFHFKDVLQSRLFKTCSFQI